MDADKVTLADLFRQDVCYLVPLYQRPYVWNETDQWRPLWDDVQSLAENSRDFGDEMTAPHFLGAVVIERLQSRPGDVDRHNLIDGQQRLTTLQLLLDALQLVMQDLGDERDAKRLEKLVLNDEIARTAAHERFKVWPTNVDRPSFEAAMDDGLDAGEYGDAALVRAHDFFRKQIETWARESDDAADALQLLSSTLMSKMQLVAITLDQDDNAQAIFETLNARGAPLLGSDLIKNDLLRSVEGSQTLAAEPFYEKYLMGFETPYWRETEIQGRLKRPRVDLFLFYWLGLRTQRVQMALHEFPSFRRYARDSGLDAEALAADLKAAGSAYRVVADHNELPADPIERQCSLINTRLNRLGAGALMPLRMHVQMLDVDPAEKLGSLQYIESWYVRRLLVKRSMASTSRFVVEILRKLHEVPDDEFARTLCDFLAGQTAIASDWPADAEFWEAVRSRPLYKQLPQYRLRLILEVLETCLRTNRTEPLELTGDLPIEHLMPQSWTPQSWPIDDDAKSHDRRQASLHKLGNLTLVTTALNSNMSNAPWSSKRPALADHSVLRLNRSLVDDYAVWNEDTIDARSAELADLLVEFWPRS